MNDGESNISRRRMKGLLAFGGESYGDFQAVYLMSDLLRGENGIFIELVLMNKLFVYKNAEWKKWDRGEEGPRCL